MMRTLSVFILLLGYYCIDAQDLIITNTGDSIECRIHQVRAEQIVFVENINGRHEGKILNLSEVADFQYNYKRVELKMEEHAKVDSLKRKRRVLENYSKVHVAVGGGIGYQQGRVNSKDSDLFESPVNELKLGTQFSSELAFFTDQAFAFGAKFSKFNFKNEMDVTIISEPFGHTSISSIDENITVMYVGPMLCFRLFNNRNPNNYFLFDLSAGYINYQNSILYVYEYFHVEGKTIGFSLGASYNVNKFQFKASLIAGSLNSAIVYNAGSKEEFVFDKNERERTTRLDFTIGLRL